jgi:hypothetical protein
MRTGFLKIKYKNKNFLSILTAKYTLKKQIAENNQKLKRK